MRWSEPILILGCAFLVSAAVIHSADANRGKARIKKVTKADSRLMDINQIECYVNNDGSFASDSATGMSGFFFPRGQRSTSMIYTSGLWVLGKVDGDLRTAACSYSTEFQPGSILPDGRADDPSKDEYRVYKYNRGDAIDQVAVDQGCPPTMLGDQMLFCVYNDLGSHADVWTTAPIGLEVQQTTFAFNQTGALGNTIFIKFRFINKGEKTLEDAYTAFFIDTDLGDGNDDYAGCDTTLGIGYVYNGDPSDEKYGTSVPALACDFFQGPIVDAPGETARLPDGAILIDKKIMKMTTFFAYTWGSPIAGMEDPDLGSLEGAQEAYSFVRGTLGNGEPWKDPSRGYSETRFPFAGDPVLDTGWTFSDILPPTDIRIGLAAGPFTLPVNEPKDVVVGLVVGQGTNNLSSIGWMKYYDTVAQYAYNANFNLPSPPPQPQVKAVQMDEALMLIWDDEPVSYSSSGYEFEGFNVWQGEQEGGPWKRIATFDKKNGITQIWDLNYDESIDALIDMPVQFGKDTKLDYHFRVEKDYIHDSPIVNGSEYFFAVTGYAYNPEGVPKVLENAKTAVKAIPQKPVLDLKYNAALGDTVPITRTCIGEGSYAVLVTDPDALTGHEYQVALYTIREPANPDSGKLAWKLTDRTIGRDVIIDQIYAEEGEAFPSADGVQIQLTGSASVFKAVVEVANESGLLSESSYDDLGRPFQGNDVWHSGNAESSADRYYLSSGGFTGSLDALVGVPDVAAPRDFELRFTAASGFGVYALNDNKICTVPFELWDVGVSTPADPSDDIRLIPFILENDSTKSSWGYASGIDMWKGFPSSDLIFWMDSEGKDGYDRFRAVCEQAGGAGYIYPSFEDGSTEGYWVDFHGGFNYPIGWLTVCDLDGNGLSPRTGTVIRFVTVKPGEENVLFTFDTAKYTKRRGTEIAKARLNEINVYPNPYFGQNSGESDFFAQFVTFTNLPEDECTIRIYSLSGQLVKAIRHANRTPFERWNLLNEQSLPVASGMYIVHVETKFGNRILKLGIINREARYQHL